VQFLAQGFRLLDQTQAEFDYCIEALVGNVAYETHRAQVEGTAWWESCCGAVYIPNTVILQHAVGAAHFNDEVCRAEMPMPTWMSCNTMICKLRTTNN